MKPTITISSSNDRTKNLVDSLKSLTRKQVLVGIPATTAHERYLQVKQILSRRTSKRAKAQLLGLRETINNAQLLYIHTNGSSLKKIPARPVVEPAIEEPTNREVIGGELKLAADAALEGRTADVTRQLKLAGVEAENRVKSWFVNPKNNWAPNKPSTIRRKGSSRPLINTAALRQAIRSIVSEEK